MPIGLTVFLYSFILTTLFRYPRTIKATVKQIQSGDFVIMSKKSKSMIA